MNWIDRAVSALNPAAGVRRLGARRALAEHTRAYDAARRDNRTASWQATGNSANAEVGAAEELVRNRSRDLIRNNGWALQIVETFADHVVGTGIVTAPTGLKGRNLKRAQQLWADFAENCDFDGDQDLNGLMWSAVKCMSESGAAIIRFRRVAFDARTTTVPLRLQLIEPDFIDVMKNGTTGDGGWIDRGIEYDGQGRRVAMWLLERHPGDAAMWRSWSMRSERVPADELVYLFNKLRPGQDRGMPLLAPAIIPLQDLKGYFDAELVRKRIGACMVGVIYSTEEGSVQVGTKPGQKPTYGPQTQKMEPGMFTRLLPGESINFNSLPADTGFDAVSTQFLRQAAAAAGVMYEHATGDFSRVNYSSWRAGHHGFRRRMERIQWNVVIHMLCRPIAARFNEAAVAAQMVAAAPTWRHTPPGFISVDPYKDAQADLLNLRIGKVSLPQLVEERGYDYVEFLMAYAEGLKQADEAFADLGNNVMFDGDPRKAAKGVAPANGKADAPAEQTDAAAAA